MKIKEFKMLNINQKKTRIALTTKNKPLLSVTHCKLRESSEKINGLWHKMDRDGY